MRAIKRILLLLTTPLLTLMLLGCSPTYVDRYVAVPAPIPNSLLQYPCEPLGPGTTLMSLERGYVENTACIGEYKITLDGLVRYNDKQKELGDARGM